MIFEKIKNFMQPFICITDFKVFMEPMFKKKKILLD